MTTAIIARTTVAPEIKGRGSLNGIAFHDNFPRRVTSAPYSFAGWGFNFTADPGRLTDD
jgi:hypothetical protein